MTTGVSGFAPKYQRIADELRRDIRAGKFQPGDRMPAETVFVERFRVSLPTVRQALGVLRAEGLVESRHGIGTFVKEDRRLQRRSRGRYGLPAGAPVLHVLHTARAADGDVLEVSESVWPADRVMIVDDYPIEQDAEQPDAPSEV